MKTNTVKTIAKVVGIVALCEFAYDLGKACMYIAVKEIHPETAKDIMALIDHADDYKESVGTIKIARAKWVGKLCKSMTE